MIHIYTINRAILMHHYWTTNVQLCFNYCATTYNLIMTQIHM
jgi:hypothetical protein